MKKTIHYRNFVITESKSTLQELLEELLKSEEYSIVDNRKEKINSTSDEIRFINSFFLFLSLSLLSEFRLKGNNE